MGLKVSADARIDSVETSISSSVREALSFSTFRTSVGPLLKQWPTTGLRRHKLTSQSDSPCRQLRPLRQATSYSKTCDVLRLGKDLASTSLSLSEVAKGTSPKHFAQQNLRCTSTISYLVSWYFEPSQPQRVTSWLKTMFNLPPIYSARKSSNHKLSINHKISHDTNLHKTKHTQTSDSKFSKN